MSIPLLVDTMIDLETTGTKPGCHIISIGACAFGPAMPLSARSESTYFHGFASSIDARFVASSYTMDWWDKQPSRVRQQLFASDQPVDKLLVSFTEYLNQFPSVQVWGNSASFDLKILERAYEICGMEPPWQYQNEMCYRTLKRLYPNIPYKKPGTSHIAIEDAIAQANHADEIFAYKAAVEMNSLERRLEARGYNLQELEKDSPYNP